MGRCCCTQTIVAAIFAALLVPPAASARQYHGYVTNANGGTIKLLTAGGVRVTRVPAGVHTFTVHDSTALHNFVLRRGATILRQTSVTGAPTVSWSVRIRAGYTYRYECSPHRTRMYGTFRGFRP